MRVLHYITGISPNIGGIERFVLNIYSNNEFSIDILTRFADKESPSYKIMIQSGLKIFNLDIHHLTLSTLGIYKRKLKSFFYEKLGEYDAIHIHSIEEPYVARYARKIGLKTICIHVHSQKTESNFLIRKVKNHNIRDNCRFSDFYFACSKSIIGEVYPKRYINKAIVVHNGIDVEHYRFNHDLRQKIRGQYCVSGLTICHVGRFVKAKNHSFLIDVFFEIYKKRKNSLLILVGDGPNRKFIETKCKDLNILDNVIFTGNVSDVNPYLQASDVFIFPSENEGLGMVTIEAQAAGLPIIATKGNIPEEIKITKLVTFIPLKSNPEEWAEIAMRVALNKEKNRQDYCEKVIHAGYNSGSTAKQLYKYYSINSNGEI